MLYLVCIATVIVILRRHEALNSIIPRILAKVGDFSYSLYLVHWPIFAFINNAYVDKSPTKIYETAIAIALALCLGFLLYRYVESPVRRIQIGVSRKLVAATVTISLTLIAIPLGIILSRTSSNNIDYEQIRRVNTGFSMKCEFTENFTPKAECRNSDKPTLLVWGDSYAMHLISGIVATTDAGVIQATQSSCGPFIGMAPMESGNNTIYTRSWSEGCLAFQQSVVDYLAATPSINVVVMSSPFMQYLIYRDKNPSLWLVDGKYVEARP